MMYPGFGNMMNFGSGFAVFGLIGLLIWIVLLIDLVLLGIWLWKQIQKNEK